MNESPDNKIIPFHKIKWDDNHSIKSFINGTVEMKDGWRLGFERTWYENLAFLQGQQWMRWDKQKRGLVPLPDTGRPRMVTNLTLPVWQACRAKVMRGKPQIEASPATSDDEDQMVAELITKVARYYWDKLDCDGIHDQFTSWLFGTGLGFLKFSWNPELGESMEFGVDSMQSREPNGDEDEIGLWLDSKSEFADLVGDPEIQSVQVGMGDVEIEALGPYGVLWDETVGFDDSGWVLVSKLREIGYVQEKYGKAAEGISADGQHDSIYQSFERRLQELPSAGGPQSSEQVNVESVVVHELFVKPTQKYPKGKYAVVAGGRLLESGDNPYRCIPVVSCQELPIPGRTIGTSRIEQIRALNVDYNKAQSQIIENRDKLVHPKLLIPNSCQVGAQSFTSKPGEKVTYEPGDNGEKPEYMVPPTLPGYLFDSQDIRRNDINHVSGINDVSHAKAPGAKSSGYSIDLLLEQDDTKFAAVVNRIGKCWSKGFRILMQILRMYVAEDRMITVAGRGAMRESTEFFSGDMLAGPKEGQSNINYHDVKIDFTTGLGESRSIKRELTIELINLGALNPQDPFDKSVILENLGLVSPDDDLAEEVRQDRMKSMEENSLMKSGQQVPVMYYENHEIELSIHNRFRKSKEFNQLPPEVQQLFHLHCQEHEQFLMGPAPQGQPQPMDPNQTAPATP